MQVDSYEEACDSLTTQEAYTPTPSLPQSFFLIAKCAPGPGPCEEGDEEEPGTGSGERRVEERAPGGRGGENVAQAFHPQEQSLLWLGSGDCERGRWWFLRRQARWKVLLLVSSYLIFWPGLMNDEKLYKCPEFHNRFPKSQATSLQDTMQAKKCGCSDGIMSVLF